MKMYKTTVSLFLVLLISTVSAVAESTIWIDLDYGGMAYGHIEIEHPTEILVRNEIAEYQVQVKIWLYSDILVKVLIIRLPEQDDRILLENTLLHKALSGDDYAYDQTLTIETVTTGWAFTDDLHQRDLYLKFLWDPEDGNIQRLEGHYPLVFRREVTPTPTQSPSTISFETIYSIAAAIIVMGVVLVYLKRKSVPKK